MVAEGIAADPDTARQSMMHAPMGPIPIDIRLGGMSENGGEPPPVRYGECDGAVRGRAAASREAVDVACRAVLARVASAACRDSTPC